MNPFMNKLIPVILITMSLAGCATQSNSAFDNPKDRLLDLSPNKTERTRVNIMRVQALRDTALSVGARGGLAWRSDEINQIIARYEKLLPRIFNFNGLMLDHNILPPVLIEARNTLNLSGTDTIHISDRSYEILKQASFTTAAPHWRDYLWLTYEKPELPDKSLLPYTKEERAIWQKYIDEGWQAGVTQANLIYRENLGRLKRDFEGMVRYRSLLAQNMVSAPYVATLDMGITGGGKDLAVNDRLLKITAFPVLKTNGNQWKTEIVQHE